MSDRPVDLAFFPDYRAANPVQAQIYTRLGPRIEARPGTIDRLSPTPGPLRPVFHLHWEDAVLRPSGARAEAFLDDLLQFRAKGGRVIWSVHNLVSHDPALEPKLGDLRAGLFRLADIIHLHSLAAVAAARARWDMPMAKVRVIAHPSYDGCYPAADRALSKAEFGLEDARMVLLMPGRIAAYKQPRALLEAFADVAGPDDRLIVAGDLEKGLSLPRITDSRIHLRSGHADTAQVSRLHAAADLVVLPYAQSLTSGSAILAATLSRGVLGPESPGLRDAVEAGRSGILYQPDAEPASLPAAMAQALAEGPEVWALRGRAAFAAMQGRDPGMIAASWADLILHLAQDRGPA